MCPLINTPHPEGVIISQPKTSFLGVVFDVDHDFEGPRAPKAHLDTVNTNLSHHLVTPRTLFAIGALSSYFPRGKKRFKRGRFFKRESGLCVPDRPTLSYDFSHFRLGLPRPTDPPREAWREKKWPFWGGSPRPTDPLLPQRAGRELFLSLLSRFLPFSAILTPTDRPAARNAARFFWVGNSVRPTHFGSDLGRRAHFQLRTPLQEARTSCTLASPAAGW